MRSAEVIALPVGGLPRFLVTGVILVTVFIVTVGVFSVTVGVFIVTRGLAGFVTGFGLLAGQGCLDQWRVSQTRHLGASIVSGASQSPLLSIAQVV